MLGACKRIIKITWLRSIVGG
uniref:Uncharacterized protein n=1 Tax=Rhizophora mucronata TaxID=61149 RepID=A0A2P2JJK2_RHIMU